LQLVENVLGVIIDWRNDPFDTGIVRERVDWTKRRLGGLDEAGDLGRVRHVLVGLVVTTVPKVPI